MAAGASAALATYIPQGGIPINSTVPHWLGSKNVMTAADVMCRYCGLPTPPSHYSPSLPCPYAETGIYSGGQFIPEYSGIFRNFSDRF